ncbi:MAG: hypothetical protein Q7T93_21325, partial [Methylobacterium sp.]|uniref:hypothetical protein n=1 Tax=Methylobacterium sp. TaxID=409 RepID=UPI002719A2D9
MGQGPLAPLNAAYWVGAAVLVAGCVLTGATLVSRGAPAVRLIVALCVPVLAWSLLGVLLTGTGADPFVVDGAV